MTVTFCADAALKFKVIPAEVTDSRPLEVEELKSTTGVVSLSLIVKVWAISVPRVALAGLDNVMITVSSGSSAESSIILAIVMLPVVSPALIVIAPEPSV